jgi:hypothetical protein
MADEFSVQVGQWVEKALGRATQAFQATAQDAVARVKELTPVKTGYLRANWTAIQGGDAVPVAGAVPDPAEAIAALKIGDVVAIVNPVVYARRVEFGFVGQDSLGRHYNQAGAGMVQQTIIEVPEMAMQAVTRVSGG